MLSDYLKVTVERFDPILVGLVELFGKNPVYQINSALISKELGIDWEKEKSRFEDDYFTISSLKGRIESINEANISKRIGEFLKTLSVISDNHLQNLKELGRVSLEISASRQRELELLNDLIIYSDGQNWSDRQLEYLTWNSISSDCGNTALYLLLDKEA